MEDRKEHIANQPIKAKCNWIWKDQKDSTSNHNRTDETSKKTTTTKQAEERKGNPKETGHNSIRH